MSLRIWLPMTKDLRNQGLDDLDEAIVQTGCAIDNNGKLGKCFTNSGTNISIATPISFSTSQFSICAWVKHNNFRSNWGRWIGLYGNDGEGKTRLGFGCEHTNGQSIGFHCWKIIDGTDTNIFDFYPTTITTGVWSHFAMCYDGIKCNVYQNGELIGSTTGKIANIECDMTKLYLFGGHPSLCSQCSLNDVRIYDHCLSPMEVKQISQGLILHYPLSRNGWGQENLLKNSTFLQQSTSWNRNGTPFSTDYSFNGRCVGTLTPSSGATSRQNMNQYITTMFADLNNLSMVTCSFWYKAEVGANTNGVGVMLRIANSNSQYNDVIAPSGLTVDGAWHYKMYTVDLSQFNNTNITSVSFLIFCQGAPVSYSMLKLELGSIATPWCPNSSDALATTMGLNDNIEYDTSGFGNNGTRVGDFSWTSDTPKYQVSTKFNGTQRIEAPWNPSGTTSFSVAGWFYHTDGTTYYAAKNTYNTYIDLESGRYFVYNSNPGAHVGNWTCTNNVWQHIVLVHDSSITKLKLYINGSFVSEVTTNGTIYNSDILDIGGRQGVAQYSGKMSDFRIYATALSANDVKSLYQNSAHIDSQGNTYASSYVEG